MAGRSIAFMRHLEKIAEAVYQARTIEEILQSLVDAVSSFSPWSMCWVGLVRGEITDATVPNFYAGFREGGHFSPRNLITLNVIRSGKPLYFRDLLEVASEYPVLAEDSANLGARSALIVPLEVGDGQGALWICTPEPHEYSPDEVTLATVIASLAAIAFRNVVSAAKARRRQEQAADELKKLNTVITTRNAQLQQLATVQETLIRILLADEGIGRIAMAISDLLDTPIVLLDRFFQVIAHARVSEQRAEELRRSFRVARVANKGRQREAPQPVTLQHESYLGSPVVVSGETVAWVVGMAPAESSGVAVAFEHACLIVGLEFLKERRRIESEIRVLRDFADALLSGDPSSNTSLSVRAGHLGIRLDTANNVLRARLAGQPDLQRGTEEFDELARKVRSRLLAYHTNAAVVALSTSELLAIVPEFEPSARRTAVDPCLAIRSAVTAALAGSHAHADPAKIPVSIGLGSAYRGADGLKRSLSEATRALEILTGLGLDDADLAYSESGSYSLLSTMSGADRDAFMSRYVRPVAAYDAQHGSQLIRTLQVFFESLGNIQKTADVLYLHVSTVRYRLSRIERVLGISIHNHDDRLCLQLALNLLRLTGHPGDPPGDTADPSPAHQSP